MRLEPRSSLALIVVCAACAPPVSHDGYLRVEVRTPPGSQAACLRVFVQPASGVSLRSRPITRDASRPEGPFIVAVYQDALGAEVAVSAVGYTDAAGCETPLSPPEHSQTVTAQFVRREITHVALFVTPEATDAGADGGAEPDAGSDAGFIDRDHDGSPADVDCDDLDPARAPTLAEQCADGIDNDCDTQVDCADSLCTGQPCALGGTCTAGTCAGATSEVCTDGVDNDRDSLIDCLDPDCANQLCNDGDGCTGGERCTAMVCGGGAPRDCSTSVPVCMVNAGCDAGQCLLGFAPENTGTCTDGFACTVNDRCNGDGGCEGSTRVCPGSANSCLIPTCIEPGGACAFYADTGAACDDNNPCTVADQCQTDGGCGGAAMQCPLQSECQVSGACTNGACAYALRTGACDGGTCNPLGQCVTTANLFNYTPSNFTESQLAGLSAPDVSLGCPVTIDTQGPDGGVVVTASGCSAAFGTTVISQTTGGRSAALLVAHDLTVSAGGSVTVVGARPLIIVATGNLTLHGPITTAAGVDLDCASTSINGDLYTRGGGGGGGGLGSTGGNGARAGKLNAGGLGQGAAGTVTLIPLRGGCSGGQGGGGVNGGRGGGSLQLSVAGNLVLDSRISASGRGGAGASLGNLGGGGGGSGGAVLLEAAHVTLSAAAMVVANGGGGGEASYLGG